MKVIQKQLSQSKLELVITISSDEMDGFFNEAAHNLSKDLTIKGFRPGKVPVDTVEQTVGSQKLFEEAANIAVRKSFPRVILENKIEAIGAPNIQVTKIAKHNDFEYKAEVMILPKVDLCDYKKIIPKVKKNSVKVTDKDVENALNFLRKSRAKFITVTREAKMGDRIEINFTASINGIKVENGESKNHPLIIGDNLFFKDFEENLIGMKEDDTREFRVKFPNDYHDKKLSGQSVDFKVKMNLVQEVDLPEINDELVKGLGGFNNVEDLKNSIQDGLTKERGIKENEKWQSEAIQKIGEKCQVEIPQLLIDSELEKMIENLRNSVKSTGLQFEDYLKHMGKTIDDLKKENKEQAEKIVKAGLILKAIGDKEKIEVPEKEIEDRINQEILKNYKSIDEAKKNIDLPRLKNYYYGIIRNEKTVQLLKNYLKN